MKKGVILLGRSNSEGETSQLAAFVSEKTRYPIIDLRTKHILPFDYEFKNRDDDFLPLIREIVDTYDIIVFATPVYWYTMSGILKTFVDRFSDCLKIEKETGRKLRGMEMAVISCGYDKELKEGFHMPFIETTKYLGMKYVGDVHGWLREKPLSDEVKEKLDRFIEMIQ